MNHDIEPQPATAEAVSVNTSKLVYHLIELRKRLFFCIYTVAAIFLCLFFFSDTIFAFITQPLLKQLPENTPLIATALTGTFVAPLKLTFFVAIFMAMPILLYQFWVFLAPGLYHHERRLIWPLLVISTLLFCLGICFAYWVVFPLLFKFFIGITPQNTTVLPDISAFINLTLKLFFAFGVAFEVPIATFLFIKSGLVSVADLQAKRPYIIVAAFTVGMLLTPPDVLSQILLAIPLYLLFEAGILFARLFPSMPIETSTINES